MGCLAVVVSSPGPAWLMKPAGRDLLPMRALGASPRSGAGLSCCASSPFLRRGLDPDGLPSLAQHGQAGCAGWVTWAALPVAGDRRPWCPSRVRDRRSRLTNWPAARALRCAPLRCAPLPCAALVPDRHPGHPPRPEPGRLNAKGQLGPARPPRQSLRLVARRSLQPPTLVIVGGPLAPAVAPAAPSRRPRCSGPPGVRSLPDEPVQPTAIPQTAPPSWVRGTCWGIFNAVGRETGSPFRLLATA